MHRLYPIGVEYHALTPLKAMNVPAGIACAAVSALLSVPHNVPVPVIIDMVVAAADEAIQPHKLIVWPATPLTT